MIFIAGPIFRWSNPAAADVDGLPSFWLWPTIVTCHAINDVWFYFGTDCSTRRCCTTIHKRHHSTLARAASRPSTPTRSRTSSRRIPVSVGLFVTGAHFHTVNVWFMYRLPETYKYLGLLLSRPLPQRCGLTFSRYALIPTSPRGNRGSTATSSSTVSAAPTTPGTRWAATTTSRRRHHRARPTSTPSRHRRAAPASRPRVRARAAATFPVSL